MQTYSSGRLYAGSLINDTSAATLTVLDPIINQAIKRVVNLREWPFLEKTKAIPTVASQQAYDLPFDLGKLIGVTVTVSTTKYTPKEAPNREFWDKLNQTVISSDTPEWFYIFNGTVELYPIPSSANTLTFIYQRTQKNLSIADYVTGGILTATNGSDSIVGTGTSWTPAMAGRWIQIADSDIANMGDGEWYEIESCPTATTMTLTRLYNGMSIVAGSALYIIGQTSIIPEAYQELPLFKTAEIYFSSIKPEPDRARRYKDLYNDGVQEMMDAESSKTTGVTMNRMKREENPNWYPKV